MIYYTNWDLFHFFFIYKYFCFVLLCINFDDQEKDYTCTKFHKKKEFKKSGHIKTQSRCEKKMNVSLRYICIPITYFCFFFYLCMHHLWRITCGWNMFLMEVDYKFCSVLNFFFFFWFVAVHRCSRKEETWNNVPLQPQTYTRC